MDLNYFHMQGVCSILLNAFGKDPKRRFKSVTLTVIYHIFSFLSGIYNKRKHPGFRGDCVRGKCAEPFKPYISSVSFNSLDGITDEASKEAVTLSNYDCLSELCPTIISE